MTHCEMTVQFSPGPVPHPLAYFLLLLPSTNKLHRLFVMCFIMSSPPHYSVGSMRSRI